MLCVECDMPLVELWWFLIHSNEEPMPYECIGFCESCGEEAYGYDQNDFDEVVS